VANRPLSYCFLPNLLSFKLHVRMLSWLMKTAS
jgi:hypothetical protein